VHSAGAADQPAAAAGSGRTRLAEMTSTLLWQALVITVLAAQDCEAVHTALARLTNQRQPLDGNFSVEVVHYSKACKGAESPS